MTKRALIAADAAVDFEWLKSQTGAAFIETAEDGMIAFPGIDQAALDAAIAAYVPVILPEQVSAECARRLCAIFGARDKAHLDQITTQATQEATRLLSDRITAGAWTDAQASRAAALQAAHDLMVAHGAASAALRALDPIPPDYADNRHWPAAS